MDGEIEGLIGRLDDDATVVAEDAKAELISLGAVVVGPLAAAVPSMRRFGLLCAIEAFEALGDVSAGPILVELLGSEHATVREWSALALAELGVRSAVPALSLAYRRQRESGDPPDHSEAAGLRHALTVLGGRRPVLPPLTASCATTVPGGGYAWPVARAAEVIDELADHGQVVLYLQLWQLRDGSAYGQGHDSLDGELDWEAPWPHLVQAAREAALLEAAFLPQQDDLVVTMEWIDKVDR